MTTKVFALPPESRQAFQDIDRSILHWSVELGKAELQAEAARRTLSGLYEARMKQMNSCIVAAGVDPSTAHSAKVDGEGKMIVEVADVVEHSGPRA